MNRRRKVLAGVLLVAAATLLASWLRSALASDESRIRKLVRSSAAGFNSRDAGDAIAGLAEDFREETSGLDRAQVRLILIDLFLRGRDPGTKRFRYRLEVPEESVEVTVDPAGARASLGLSARLQEGEGESSRLVWEARIEAELEKRKGGWKLKRSRYRTLKGRPPG
jgi:hypothetical protein